MLTVFVGLVTKSFLPFLGDARLRDGPKDHMRRRPASNTPHLDFVSVVMVSTGPPLKTIRPDTQALLQEICSPSLRSIVASDSGLSLSFEV